MACKPPKPSAVSVPERLLADYMAHPRHSAQLARLLATMLLLLFARSLQALPINYPEWLEAVPGSPPGDTELFYKYALGREASRALEALLPEEQPYLSSQDNTVDLALDFAGRQDVAYLFESRAEGASEDSWTPVCWKLGPTPWQVADGSFSARITEDSLLRIRFPQDQARLFRLRALRDDTLLNPAQAVRFLKQATFGPKLSEVSALLASSLDFEAWIDEQIETPPTFHVDAAARIAGFSDFQSAFPLGKRHGKGMLWFEVSLNAADQLRQRMAWSLFQIAVLGESGSGNNGALDEWATYYDHYIRNATGNYRDLLQDITLSPKMGRYLTYLNNQKANASGTRQPDENYAREVMQLFTIGLWELNRDGSLKKDNDQQAIPTYDNEDIVELARVFTGLVRAPDRDDVEDKEGDNWIDPMVPNENRHDTEEKVLVDGSVLPAGQDTLTDITQALDALFEHPNTAPFVSIRLIQRLTTSNPSPQYIERVAAVFEDDGTGVRGNLAAIAKAILLDPEARSGAFLVDPTRGKLREPLVRFTQYCRSFELASNRPDQLLYLTDLQSLLGQFPYRSPSVFNFYLPDFSPSGEIRKIGLVAPEFQILDDNTGIGTFLAIDTLVRRGLVSPVGSGRSSQGSLDYSFEQSLAHDAAALVRHLNLLLCNNGLSETESQAILDAVEALPPEQASERTQRALALFAIAPSFNTLR